MQPPSPPPACPGPHCLAQLDGLVGNLPDCWWWHTGPSQEPQTPTAAHPFVPAPYLLHTHLAHQSQGNCGDCGDGAPQRLSFSLMGLALFFFYIVHVPAISLCWGATTTGEHFRLQMKQPRAAQVQGMVQPMANSTVPFADTPKYFGAALPLAAATGLSDTLFTSGSAKQTVTSLKISNTGRFSWLQHNSRLVYAQFSGPSLLSATKLQNADPDLLQPHRKMQQWVGSFSPLFSFLAAGKLPVVSSIWSNNCSTVNI